MFLVGGAGMMASPAGAPSAMMAGPAAATGAPAMNYVAAPGPPMQPYASSPNRPVLPPPVVCNSIMFYLGWFSHQFTLEHSTTLGSHNGSGTQCCFIQIRLVRVFETKPLVSSINIT